jgi:hypothetical protein
MVTPNTAYQITASAGARIYYYYTYSLPAGGEQNTSAYKKNFVVGNCSNTIVAGFDAEEFTVEGVEEINIHPNPSNDEFIFSLDKTLEGGIIRIVDATGKEQRAEVIMNERKVKVTSLSPGLYLFSVQKGMHKAAKRFIKQ